MADEARGEEQPAVRLQILPLTNRTEVCPRVLKTTATAELVELDGFTFIRKRPAAPTSDPQQPSKRPHAATDTAEEAAQPDSVRTATQHAQPASEDTGQGSHAEAQKHAEPTDQPAGDSHPGNEQGTMNHENCKDGDAALQPLHHLLLQDLPADLPTLARLQLVVSSLLLPAQLNTREGQQAPLVDASTGPATAAAMMVVQRFGTLVAQQVAAARALLVQGPPPCSEQATTLKPAAAPGAAPLQQPGPAAVADASTVTSENAEAGAVDAAAAVQTVPDGHAPSSQQQQLDATASPLLYKQFAPMVRAAAEGPGLRATLSARLAALLEEEAMWQKLAQQHQGSVRPALGDGTPMLQPQSVNAMGLKDTCEPGDGSEGGLGGMAAEASVLRENSAGSSAAGQGTLADGSTDHVADVTNTACTVHAALGEAHLMTAAGEVHADCALAVAAQQTYESMATQVELLEGEVLRLQEMLRRAHKAAADLQAQYHSSSFELLAGKASPKALIKGLTALPGPPQHILQAATPLRV